MPDLIPTVARPLAAGGATSAAAFEIARVLIAIAIVVAAARIVGALGTKIGQPRVIGEIAAGIILGPSVIGAAIPDATSAVFDDVQPTLEVIAKLGLVFFMFLVGLEFERDMVRGQGRVMGMVFVSSLTTPFLLGVGLGYLTHDTIDPGVDVLSYSLFLGAAMAITAFPVLARILAEKGMDRTPVGVLALACAALEDVFAWLILAVVVAIVRSDGAGSLVVTLALTALFAAGMVLVVRPLMAWLTRRLAGERGVGPTMLSIILIGVLLSAWATEEIGIHAIFGAFAFGAVLPRDSDLVGEVTLKLEDFTVLLFLPVFFAVAGLKTEVGSVDGLAVALCGVAILVAAIVGKVVPVWLAARAGGVPQRDALTLGVLMNTRGLTELVIISVGLELGVVNEPMFAILVLVALITTFMTAPLLGVVQRRAPVPAAAEPAPAARDRILVALEGADGDAGLAELAARLAEPTGAVMVLARVLPPPDRLARRTTVLEAGSDRAAAADALDHLARAYRAQGFEVETRVEEAPEVGAGVVDLAGRLGVALTLMGYHHSLLGTHVLGGAVGVVLSRCPGEVAVLVDRTGRGVALGRGRSVLAPYGGGLHERASVGLAERLAAASGAPLRVLARDESSAADLGEAGPPPGEVAVAGADPRQDLAAAVGGAGILVIGAGQDWVQERRGIGRSRARLVSGVEIPVVVVRAAEGADPDELRRWLRSTRESRLADWLGTRAGRAPASAPAP